MISVVDLTKVQRINTNKKKQTPHTTGKQK